MRVEIDEFVLIRMAEEIIRGVRFATDEAERARVIQQLLYTLERGARGVKLHKIKTINQKIKLNKQLEAPVLWRHPHTQSFGNPGRCSVEKCLCIWFYKFTSFNEKSQLDEWATAAFVKV